MMDSRVWGSLMCHEVAMVVSIYLNTLLCVGCLQLACLHGLTHCLYFAQEGLNKYHDGSTSTHANLYGHHVKRMYRETSRRLPVLAHGKSCPRKAAGGDNIPQLLARGMARLTASGLHAVTQKCRSFVTYHTGTCVWNTAL